MTVSLTGECADEIFGGYPWFFRTDSLNNWYISMVNCYRRKTKIIKHKIASKINLKDYIDFRYNESLSEVDILDADSKETAEKRKNFILNIKLVHANFT